MNYLLFFKLVERGSDPLSFDKVVSPPSEAEHFFIITILEFGGMLNVPLVWVTGFEPAIDPPSPKLGALPN